MTGVSGSVGTVGTANVDGSNQATVYSSTRWFAPSGIAVDYATNEIFTNDPIFNRIERMNLNGVIEQIIPTSGVPGGGIAVDSMAGKLYWTDSSNGHIFRANLDGSNQETVLSDLNHFSGSSWNLGGPDEIALDQTNGKMYWNNQFEHIIMSANLDGTGQQVILSGLDEPTDIAIDGNSGKIYWTDWDGTIHVANLDGSEAKTLLNNTSELSYGNIRLALDLDNNKLYWGNMIAGQIWSANLDGTDSQEVIGGFNYDWDFTLGPTAQSSVSEPVPSSVPEPATLGFAVCGGLALALRAWRKSQKN